MRRNEWNRFKWMVWLIAAMWQGAAGGLSAEEFRTFTNKEGRSIEAKALEWDEANVTLEMRSGQTFVVPIASLSLEDQGWLANEVPKAAAPSRTIDPDRWHRVEITLPSSECLIEAPGIHGAFYRTGLKTWTGELPEGAWLRVGLPKPGEAGSPEPRPEFLTCFDGDFTTLRLEFDEGLFLQSKDGGKPRIAGLSCKVVLSEDGAEDQGGGTGIDIEQSGALQTAYMERILSMLGDGERICLQPAVPVPSEEVAKLGDRIESMILSSPPLWGMTAHADAFGLRALRVLDGSNTWDLKMPPIPTLECLSTDGLVRETRPLADQTALTTLEMGAVYAPQGLVPIASLETLRYLKVDAFQGIEAVHELDGWSAMPVLTGIDFNPRRCRVSSASVAKCVGLKALRFEDHQMSRAGEWLHPLTSLRNIYWSAYLDATGIFDFAARADAPPIRHATNLNATPFASLPELRSIVQPGLRQRDGAIYQWNPKHLPKAAELEYLCIDGIGQEGLDSIAAIQKPDAVKALILTNLVDCGRFIDLQAFVNLRLLSLSHFHQTSPGSANTRISEVDLRGLPRLEAVEVLPNNGYETFVYTDGEYHKRISNDRTEPLFPPR